MYIPGLKPCAFCKLPSTLYVLFVSEEQLVSVKADSTSTVILYHLWGYLPFNHLLVVTTADILKRSRD